MRTVLTAAAREGIGLNLCFSLGLLPAELLPSLPQPNSPNS